MTGGTAQESGRRRGGMFILVALLLLASAPAASAGRCPARNAEGFGRAIAEGHAWAKHKAQFREGAKVHGLRYPDRSITNVKAFAALIANIIDRPDKSAPIENDRTKYWRTASGTIVIVNMHADDCGTAFRPARGVEYYNHLR